MNGKMMFDIGSLVVLISFLLYMIISWKKSMTLQKEAVERQKNSGPKIEESITMQRDAVAGQKESLALQREGLEQMQTTNKLLAELIAVLKESKQAK